MSCPFCDYDQTYITSSLAIARYDAFPVTEGHTLVTTKRHVSSYFECTDEEKTELWLMVDRVRLSLEERFAVKDFNVGINAGVTAGQTVMHVHIHVIPRRSGDMEDPRGGVRGVIPGRQKY